MAGEILFVGTMWAVPVGPVMIGGDDRFIA